MSFYLFVFVLSVSTIHLTERERFRGWPGGPPDVAWFPRQGIPLREGDIPASAQAQLGEGAQSSEPRTRTWDRPDSPEAAVAPIG